jgi:RimJ/RimL family protein N-acetyltransferase
MNNANLLPHIAHGVMLRRLSPNDLAAFQAYRHDPVVGQYQGWTALPDAQALAFLTDMGNAALLQPGAWCQIGICTETQQELMGDIGLLIAHDQSYAEIGFSLNPKYQHQGLATRAVREAIALVFAHTPVSQVLGIADARNTPSIRLLERLGMQRIATLDAVFKGEACSEHTYALSNPTPETKS